MGAVPLIWSMLTGICSLIALALFVRALYQKTWYKENAGKAVQVSVIMCAATYLGSTLLAFVYFMTIAIAKESEAVFWGFALFYLFSILLNIYIWIQRIHYVYADSTYGFNFKFVRFLKIYYLIMILLLLLILIIYAIDGGRSGTDERDGSWIQTLTHALFLIFGVLFAAELVILLVAFTSKLRALYKIASTDLDGADNTDAVIVHQVQSLFYLQRKLTILVCVQVLSSMIAFVSVIPLDGDATLAGVTVDAFFGFLCVYCTLKTHDSEFRKLCFCCIIACDACTGEQAKKPASETNIAVASTTKPDSEMTADATATTNAPDSESMS